MECNEHEKVMNESVREIMAVGKVFIDRKEVEPWVVIFKESGKVRVVVNSEKKYRVLDEKNLIENSLDVLLVDTVREVLKTIAEREEETERGVKDDKRTVCGNGRNCKDDSGFGSSGTETSGSRVL